MPPRKNKASESAAAARVTKKASAMPSRDERIAGFLDKFNKKNKGRAMIKPASEYQLPFMTKRMPTGLLTLDLELKGGFPCGGLSQIIGPKNSGKSWLTWQVARQQQFYHGDDFRCLLAMTEMRADRGQARLAGVQIAMGEEDIELLERARIKNGLPPFTEEEVAAMMVEVGQFHELHGESAEVLYDGVLAAVESNAYHLIIIDSFGSIMSGAEAENESLSDKTYGGAAGVNSQFLRKLGGLLTIDDDYGKARDVCILGVNQIRDAIGQPNKEYRASGGKALEHAKFVDLYVASGAAIGEHLPVYTAAGTKQQFVQSGKEVNWKIEKGKAGIHEGGRGKYVYDFRIGTVDFYLDTLVAAVQTGVVEVNGAWYRIRDPQNPDQYLVNENGKDAFVAKLVADSQEKSSAGDDGNSLMNIIRAECFRRKDIHVNYTWD